jgi:sugar phosphate permease
VYRLVLQGVALLAGAPFIYWVGMGSTLTITSSALFVFGLFRGIYDANIYASLYEIVPSAAKSAATGIMIMFAFLTGAFAPLILGVLKPSLGLSAGMSSLWISYVLGGLCIMIAVKYFFNQDRLKVTIGDNQ